MFLVILTSLFDKWKGKIKKYVVILLWSFFIEFKYNKDGAQYMIFKGSQDFSFTSTQVKLCPMALLDFYFSQSSTNEALTDLTKLLTIPLTCVLS